MPGEARGRSGLERLHQAVIVRMAADPEPCDSTSFEQAYRSISQRDAHRVDRLPSVNLLELQAGMVWILSKQPVRLARSVSDRSGRSSDAAQKRGVAREFTGRLDRRPSHGRRFGRRAFQRRAC